MRKERNRDMISKYSIAILTIFLCCVYSVEAKEKNDTEEIKLLCTISPQKEEYKIGDQIEYEVVMKNISDHDICYNKHLLEFNSSLNVSWREHYLFIFSSIGTGRMTVPNPTLLHKYDYKTIPKNATIKLESKEFMLNQSGIIELSSYVKNSYGYYLKYNSKINKHKKVFLDSAWVGEKIVSHKIIVSKTVSKKVKSDINKLYDRLISAKVDDVKEVTRVFRCAPEYSAKYIIKRFDEFKPDMKQLIFKSFNEIIACGDGYKVMSCLYTFYFSDIKLSTSQKKNILKILEKGFELIRIKKYSYGYEFKPEIIKKIKTSK